MKSAFKFDFLSNVNHVPKKFDKWCQIGTESVPGVTNAEKSLVEYWKNSPLEMCHLPKTFLGLENILSFVAQKSYCFCVFKAFIAIYQGCTLYIINPKTYEAYKQRCKCAAGSRPGMIRAMCQWKDSLLYGTNVSGIFRITPFADQTPLKIISAPALAEHVWRFSMSCCGDKLYTSDTNSLLVYDLNTLTCISKLECDLLWHVVPINENAVATCMYKAGIDSAAIWNIQTNEVTHLHCDSAAVYNGEVYYFHEHQVQNSTGSKIIPLKDCPSRMLEYINDQLMVFRPFSKWPKTIYNRKDDIYDELYHVDKFIVLDDIVVTFNGGFIGFYK
jgi:hypothetical protein